MKIEMESNAALCIAFVFAALAASAFGMFYHYQYNLTEREAIKAGLVQKQIPGFITTVPTWDKP